MIIDRRRLNCYVYLPTNKPITTNPIKGENEKALQLEWSCEYD